MDEEKIMDNTLPAPTDSEQVKNDFPKNNQVKNDQNKDEQPKPTLREMATSVCIVIYRYIGELKGKSHNSLGNLIFQETMKMTVAASLASESIGRDKFFENLEDGFYSSGRLLVYLDFAGTLGVHDELRQAIVETVTGIHKIFAASVKTVRSKQPKMASSQVPI